jgi:hypothetical protein
MRANLSSLSITEVWHRSPERSCAIVLFVVACGNLFHYEVISSKFEVIGGTN